MADLKKPTSQKASPKKSGSKAVVKRASSEVKKIDPAKEYEGKNIVISQPVIMECLSILRKVFHSGPLPSPEDFAKYDKALPGAAERLMRMTERNQILRFIERYSGQLFAFVLALVLGGGFLFVASHSQNAFISLSGASFLAGVVYFLKNKK